MEDGDCVSHHSQLERNREVATLTKGAATTITTTSTLAVHYTKTWLCN